MEKIYFLLNVIDLICGPSPNCIIYETPHAVIYSICDASIEAPMETVFALVDKETGQRVKGAPVLSILISDTCIEI